MDGSLASSKNKPGEASAPRKRAPKGTGPPRPSRACRTHLLLRDNLDHRTRAHREFDTIAGGIARDLSGGDPDQLTTVERQLIEAFAGAALHISAINAKILLGEKVNIITHSQAVSMLVRIAARLGISRRFVKDITPTLDEIAKEIAAQRDAAQATAQLDDVIDGIERDDIDREDDGDAGVDVVASGVTK
jgi:hypothetical protein